MSTPWQPLTVPRCEWATISTGLDPIPALAPSTDILLHTGLLDNPSLAVDKGSGLCEALTTSFTRRKNELLDQLGSKRITNTPCCLRKVQELVEVTGKAFHACILWWSASICSAGDGLHEARALPTHISPRFAKSSNKLTEPSLWCI